MRELAEAVVLLPEPFAVLFNAINEGEYADGLGHDAVIGSTAQGKFHQKIVNIADNACLQLWHRLAWRYHSAALVSTAARVSRMASASLSLSNFRRRHGS